MRRIAPRLRYHEFERRARRVFNAIPPELRAGVDHLVVERRAVPHPTLPDVYTLGECATGELDAGSDLPDVMRSTVVLYFGSFARLAQMEDGFDWEGEIWETVVHEVRHHRESAAGDDALEEMDYAEDQNFARREGEAFDPYFYRAGEPVGEGTWEVDRDRFVEVVLGAKEFEALAEVAFPWGGGEARVPRPAELGDVHLVSVAGLAEGPEEVVLALVRRRGAWESLLDFLRRREPAVLSSAARAEVSGAS